MEAWLSWLEHTVHIREVTGSSPVASTNAKTLLFSRVFLLPLVFATASKVRSAPHTLCALCPSVTLHAPLSNASISAPLMSESCPSATRNLKDFSGCFLFHKQLRLRKVPYEIKTSECAAFACGESLSEREQDGRLQSKRLELLPFLLSPFWQQNSNVRPAPRTACAL